MCGIWSNVETKELKFPADFGLEFSKELFYKDAINGIPQQTTRICFAHLLQIKQGFSQHKVGIFFLAHQHKKWTWLPFGEILVWLWFQAAGCGDSQIISIHVQHDLTRNYMHDWMSPGSYDFSFCWSLCYAYMFITGCVICGRGFAS